MSLKSKILIPVAAGVLLAAGTVASSFANSSTYTGSPSTYTGNGSISVAVGQASIHSSGNQFGQERFRLPGGSDTASHYFRVGVKQFEKGNLDRAEEAFNAVLLANGLNQQAHYYLAKINIEQGDKEAAAKHALKIEAYKKASENRR